MEPPAGDSLTGRLARLEAEVERLGREVAALRGAAPVRPVPPRRVPVVPAARRVPLSERVAALGSADVLARIGIALLLLGVAFLLKYSIDQGWIGPAVRVGMGVALGLALVGGGGLLRTRRAELSLVLQGGGIAALYASLFAAFQLYGLVGYTLAFVLMTAVTALGFGLAVMGRSAVLSVVAVLGGLGTPFLLNRDAGTLVGLMAYVAIVLAGGSAVFLRFGWRSLLAALSLGGAAVLAAAAAYAFPDAAPWSEKMAFQMGVGLVWAAATLLPLAPRQRAAYGDAEGVLAVLAAALLWTGSAYAWRLGGHATGLLGMALALPYVAAAALTRPAPTARQALAIAAALLFAVGWVVRMENAVDFVGPAFAGAALAFFSAPGDRGARFAARTILGATGLGAATYMAAETAGRQPFFNVQVWALLATLALLAGGVYALRMGRVAFLLVYALGLQWLLYTLGGLSGGGAWASVAWGVVGLGAVALGVRREAAALRLTGLATLVVAIGKLLLLDLPQLSLLARTLLFLAAGAVLLVVSYFVPNLLRRAPDETAPPTPADG